MTNTNVVPTIPGYRIEREIGRGGSGVVYAARRLSDDAPVAVKLLHPEHATTTNRQRLGDEARACAAADHPGLVKVLDLGEHEGTSWLVMERVDGPSLQSVLADQGPLDWPTAAELIAQVADAVAALHSVGLVHGDVKPANILFETPQPSGRPRVKLGDFGVARRVASDNAATGTDTETGLTETSAWLFTDTTRPADSDVRGGTASYMPPEQWSDGRLTTTADVYALGGTLYAALTGRRPFPEKSLTTLAYAVANQPAPRPSQLRPDIPPGFDEVVTRAMAKDPADRYPSAADFASAVRSTAEALHGPTVTVPTVAAVPATGSSNSRRRRWGLLGRILSPTGLLLALLCFGLPFVTVSCQGPDGTPPPGANANYTGADLAVGTGPRNTGKLTPEERRALDLPPQPLIAGAAVMLALGLGVSVLRRRRHLVIVGLTAGTAVALSTGLLVARAQLAERLATLLPGRLPRGHTVSELLVTGRAFWICLTLVSLVGLAHAAVVGRRWWRRRH